MSEVLSAGRLDVIRQEYSRLAGAEVVDLRDSGDVFNATLKNELPAYRLGFHLTLAYPANVSVNKTGAWWTVTVRR